MAHGLPGFKDLLIMVADDVFQYSLLHVSGDPVEMVEASYISVYWGFSASGSMDWNSRPMRVVVFILPLALLVDVLAVNGDAHGSCVEGLVFHLAEAPPSTV